MLENYKDVLGIVAVLAGLMLLAIPTAVLALTINIVGPARL